MAGSSAQPLILHHRVEADRYRHLFDLRAVDGPPKCPGYHLYYDEAGMALLNGDEQADRKQPREFRLRLDHIKRRAAQRLVLARACGAGHRPAVADLMAGWGVDGLCLALKGCAVTLIERSPVVWAMLDECVLRHALAATVVLGDASVWCRDNEKSVEVAYLDPIFPLRRKAALPEKALQHLRALAWKDELDLAQRIEQAKGAARERVVVKRRAGALATPKPSWQVDGRRIRFDVYRV